MEWYEAEVRQLEQKVATNANLEAPAAFYGSSTIRLWESLAEDLHNVCALNLGFGGSTLEACDYYFDRIVVPAQPQSIVLYAGDNDLGDGRTPEQVLGSFRQIRAKVEAHFPEIPFAFISIKPSVARFPIIDRIREANQAIEADIVAWGKASGKATYISIFEAMLGPDGTPRPELFLEDGLHLSASGYALWADLLVQYKNVIFNRNSPDCHI